MQTATDDPCQPSEKECASMVGSLFERPRPRTLTPTQTVGYHLKTLFLFTASDFKTVILPQSIFAISSVLSPAVLPPAAVQSRTLKEVAPRIPQMLLWIWQALLVECIANQRLPGGVVEDAASKPYRPLPAGRLSPEQARQWLLAAVVIVVSASAALDVTTPCLALLAMVWAYNDLEGSSSSGIWVRNALNAGGLMCFSWGALAVLAGGEAQLGWESYRWILHTGAIIMTTVHAQDFPDVAGDGARGRDTLPLLYGDGVARGSLVVMVVFWSVFCPVSWGVSWQAGFAPAAIGVAMVMICGARKGQRWDEAAWKLWCFWVTSLYLLPIFSADTMSSGTNTGTPSTG